MSRPGVDPARLAAYRVLRRVGATDAYANLALAAETQRLSPRDAGFATELCFGTCRGLGTYDAILEAAAGRPVARLDPPVLDVLRLGAHQLLGMRVPSHAAVSSSVDLAAGEVGRRVTGLVNAVLRKVAARDLAGWVELLSAGLDEPGALALATQHPRWIVEAWRESLGDRAGSELREALLADNAAPTNHLVVRPGLADVDELGGEPARYSPFGAYVPGAPGAVAAVGQGRAGVQDEGSQLVALALSRVPSVAGPWLDLCAGPGGKAALLAGLARGEGERLVASELQPHRARLVAANLAAYPEPHRPVAIVADGTRPAWAPGSFARVMADVPCSGLGALRRRPESRWRRRPDDLPELVALQHRLLAGAIAAARPGGVVAYVTCSPHPAETREVVAAAAGVELLDAEEFLPEVSDAAAGDFVQLWP
ncbi:MAG: transcription antitermination factor NusB, partial [Propionicimonas sp.]|nr:transcription antitermination factor NusB [Propionicimonas sp.]